MAWCCSQILRISINGNYLLPVIAAVNQLSYNRFNYCWSSVAKSTPKELRKSFNTLSFGSIGMLVSLKGLALMCRLFFSQLPQKDTHGVRLVPRPLKISS
ncbi:hypothetical protein U9M48_027471 [Paspalum notatum var. saurae]|uniref:Uncharacterized protein n=1 Tax=Paspalum notatum var. saurae TaxID=547442 RepID=A0AAQ3TT14_PASNO